MIGYTKEQVKNKLKHLESISLYKGNYSSEESTLFIFTKVYSALDSYYDRKTSSEFKGQSYNTFKKVVMDALYRNLKCSHMELLPKPDTNYPKGYRNISDIFQVATFQEIMSISDKTFNDAFYSESSGESGNYVTVYRNSYLDSWYEKLSASIINELSLLKALENYCLYGYENISMTFIFEELGNVWNSFTDDKRSFAEIIFIERGWDWFEQTFNVGIFIPSYIAEIRK